MTIFRPNCERRSAWALHRPPPPTLPRPTTPLRLRWRPITENHRRLRRHRPLLPLRRRRRAAGPPPRRLRDWTKMAPPPTQNRRWKPRTRFSKTGVKIAGNFLMNRCHRSRIHFVAFVDNCGGVVLTASMATKHHLRLHIFLHYNDTTLCNPSDMFWNGKKSEKAMANKVKAIKSIGYRIKDGL